MANIVKGLIEYEGIADFLPQFTEKFAPIKQFNVAETLELPISKPDIEQLIKVKSELVINYTKVIKTPKATSFEEQELTGWKLIVEGELRQVIQYVAEEPTQSVHGAHFNVPISTYIVLPPDFEEDKCVTVEGYIEDIYAATMQDYYMEDDVVSKRTRKIFKNITILLVAHVGN